MAAESATPKALGQGDLDLAEATSASGSRRNDTSTQSFEWIAHGDATARRRARAHVSREIRKHKGAKPQLQDECDDIRQRERHTGHNAKSKSGNVSATTAVASPSTAKYPVQRLMLHKALGLRQSDPFSSFPIKLTPDAHALLDHFFYGLAPIAFAGDTPNFQPVKKILFDLGITDASLFHMILSAAADDIAAMRGRQSSEEAIKHRAIALSMVNKRISEYGLDPSDLNLTTVALLAGWDLLFGTPLTFNTHMDGFTELLRLKGGIQLLRDTNPQLYSLVSWFDFSGQCNIVARRRLVTTKYEPELCTTLEGVPEHMHKNIPAGYDLYKELVSTFEGMYTMTSIIRSKESAGTRSLAIPNSINRVDAELYRLICLPDQIGTRSRRRNLLQSLYILTLIYTILVSAYEGPATEVFLYQLEKTLPEEASNLGSALTDLFRLLLAGEAFSTDVFTWHVSQFVETCLPLSWSSWRDIKVALLGFFVQDTACQGLLQDLWKNRMAVIRGEGTSDTL
ncbi:hypothetical protein N431DRAFT_485662 [Stipitochalara longipes BDJ]|nr:hypothetical protein N431DRAFT_485662 [Stipitochalara longipes BDJ]